MADIGISKKAKKKAKKADKDDSNRAKSEAAIREMREDFQGYSEDEAPKKGGTKKLVLLAVVLLLVGGGAGGAWMFLLQPADEAEPEVVEVETEVFPKAYLEPEPVHITFHQNGRRRRLIVYLKLVVEQREGHVVQVKQAMPRLQEAFWRTLNGAPLKGSDSGAIELSDVKERVLAASEKVLGPHIVNDVLIRDARVIRG